MSLYMDVKWNIIHKEISETEGAWEHSAEENLRPKSEEKQQDREN
jgi:hypothetical protein